jgi:hypothetical protein
MHVATNSLFINVARTLWGFDIQHARDEKGNVIPVDTTTKGLMPVAFSNAKPFPCCTSLFILKNYGGAGRQCSGAVALVAQIVHCVCQWPLYLIVIVFK